MLSDHGLPMLYRPATRNRGITPSVTFCARRRATASFVSCVREDDTESTTRTSGVMVTEWWIEQEWLAARYDAPRDLIDRGIALSERLFGMLDEAETTDASEADTLDVA